eukprot:GFUD01026071.1.p1 GENE.GFUD01026071.1~~GFUD01026071.1.p1  ORF type:complete len:384 (-),score=81.75 GFUD01026071.1:244-1395(-)
MDMESEILEDVLKKGADLLFGPYSNTTEEDTGPTTEEDPFFQDTFFHPSLIKDDEPCKAILHYHVGDSNLRVWDILILLPNIAFLFFLFYRLPSTRLRLRATNSKVFRTLYTIVVTCSLVSSLRCFIAMLIHLANPTHDMANTVIWIIGRFVFLTSELSVALLGLTSGSAERTGHTRRIVFACSVIAFIICTIQAYLEIFQPFYGFQVMHSGYKMFGHGGPMFWAVTSFLLILFYSLILCAPFCPTKSLTMLPHPRLFYCYISAQLVTNLLTGLGATLLAMNTHSGLCITNITSYAYFSLLAPLTYFCFLHPWFTTAQPSLLFAYKAQLDEEEEDGTFPTSSSIQSFQLGTDPPAVPQASFICDPIYNPGLQSPVVTEQKLLV